MRHCNLKGICIIRRMRSKIKVVNMKRYVTIVISALFASHASSPPTTSHQYRLDYIYDSKNDAFYKIHLEEYTYQEAEEACQLEGAQLLQITSDEDILQVSEILRGYPFIGNYVWTQSDGAEGEHEYVDTIPYMTPEYEDYFNYFSNKDSSENKEFSRQLCNVLSRGEGGIFTKYCHSRLPFVCKVQASDAPYDDQCDVYAFGYDYYTSVGSCYKPSRIAYTWNHAYEECRNQGAHLVVLNSDIERRAVQDLLKVSPIPPNSHSPLYFTGFRAKTSRTVTTIEPNNSHEEEHRCGAINSIDMNLYNVNCDNLHGFVCEKEVK